MEPATEPASKLVALAPDPEGKRRLWAWGFLGAAVWAVGIASQASGQPAINRGTGYGWLELKYAQGKVIQLAPPRPARYGDRLQSPGDGMETSAQSSAMLEADNGIGQVRMAGGSQLIVSRMEKLADGGRLILIKVPRGQVRFQVRRFTNPSSRFEVATPAGVAAVRGTDFGVNTDTQERTMIATAQGMVLAIAQGQEVEVNPGFLSQILPGQPPSPPRKLDRELDTTLLQFRLRGNTIKIRAQVNPDNLVFLAGKEQALTPQGEFDVIIPRTAVGTELTVRNALGEEKKHRIRDLYLGPLPF